ncbi:hypothetical protein [Clostridium perfringens]|nr:hypothetical protein [Clostridium perfringens]
MGLKAKDYICGDALYLVSLYKIDTFDGILYIGSYVSCSITIEDRI